MGNKTIIPKNTRVLAEEALPCPRCKKLMQTREHIQITQKLKKQPFYYSKWYNCVNPDCQTNLVMPDHFRVWKQEARSWGPSWVKQARQAKKQAKAERATPQEQERLIAVQNQLKPPWED